VKKVFYFFIQDFALPPSFGRAQMENTLPLNLEHLSFKRASFKSKKILSSQDITAASYI